MLWSARSFDFDVYCWKAIPISSMYLVAEQLEACSKFVFIDETRICFKSANQIRCNFKFSFHPLKNYECLIILKSIFCHLIVEKLPSSLSCERKRFMHIQSKIGTNNKIRLTKMIKKTKNSKNSNNPQCLFDINWHPQFITPSLSFAQFV